MDEYHLAMGLYIWFFVLLVPYALFPDLRFFLITGTIGITVVVFYINRKDIQPIC